MVSLDQLHQVLPRAGALKWNAGFCGSREVHQIKLAGARGQISATKAQTGGVLDEVVVDPAEGAQDLTVLDKLSMVVY
jgi:hypothetical protein